MASAVTPRCSHHLQESDVFTAYLQQQQDEQQAQGDHCTPSYMLERSLSQQSSVEEAELPEDLSELVVVGE
jgi:hypothetical protein